MICGNEDTQSIVKNFFDNIKKNTSFNFLVLEGPTNVGKSKLIKELSKYLLGDSFENDFLGVYDLSYYLEKKHSLKIETSEKESIINANGKDYRNWGVRQIKEWLSKSPTGDYKIVFLENIERMTNSAANAFLKNFEEPLNNRIIVATTTNRNFLLDTIASRAFIVGFNALDNSTLRECIKKDYPDLQENHIDLVSSFSMGRYGFAKQIIEALQNDKSEYNEILSYFERFLKLFSSEGNYHEKVSILNYVYKIGFLELFLDACVFYFSKNKEFENIDKIFELKSLINSNVSNENAFLYMSL